MHEKAKPKFPLFKPDARLRNRRVQPLALPACGASDGFRFFTGFLSGAFQSGAVSFHGKRLRADFFLQSLQSLVDIVVADNNLYHLNQLPFLKRAFASVKHIMTIRIPNRK